MQKVYVSLIFVSVLAYGTQEKKDSLNNTSTLPASILQQLQAKRPVEQDTRTRYSIPASIPSIGGKQLEANLSQLAHASKALGGIALTYYAGSLCAGMKNDEDYYLLKEYEVFFAMLLFTAFCTLDSSYAYLNGEQKIPVHIVDASKTAPTEKSSESETGTKHKGLLKN